MSNASRTSSDGAGTLDPSRAAGRLYFPLLTSLKNEIVPSKPHQEG